MTQIISSQRHINDEIVAEKIAMFQAEGIEEIDLPCYEVGNYDGKDLAILADGHHRLEAARELGIKVNFEIQDNPDGLKGEALLESSWNDSDWYYVETGRCVW